MSVYNQAEVAGIHTVTQNEEGHAGLPYAHARIVVHNEVEG